jgi:hypothetical protein
MSTEDTDPLDDPGYQEFLCETAKRCRSQVQRPCPGCCAGGICDAVLERDDWGQDGSGFNNDDDDDEET